MQDDDLVGLEEDEDLDDDEDYDSEFWGDDYEDRLYEERRERELFGE